MNATALLLADARFPVGADAHSGGIEAAVEANRVVDEPTLRSFLAGRLATSGLVTATLAAVACAGEEDWHVLDAEAEARTPSPAQRRASRTQGRQMRRTGAEVWPSPRLDSLTAAPHLPVALGAVGWSAKLDTIDVAVIAARSSVSGPAAAAIRLLGLDPVGVARVLAELAQDVDAVATHAMSFIGMPLEELPCRSAPRLDIDAELHECWEVRLFAS